MQVVETIEDVRRLMTEARLRRDRIGFVPTMGALHAGHLSLMDAARTDCEVVITSIFVNPTQFAPQEDLSRYPRPKERDLDLCRAARVDVVFYPTVDTMYPPGSSTTVTVDGLTSRWEGAIRPTHFQGVTTVVTKLFQIVMPDAAYFGQKDYQQQAVIRRMVHDLNMPIDICTRPTIRDPDGLAMSSRNAYLSTEERAAGLCLIRALREGETLLRAGAAPQEVATLMERRIEGQTGVQLDYAAVVDPDTLEPAAWRLPTLVGLVACRVGSTRLIDNAEWK